METVAPVSQVPIAVLVVVMICALAAGVVTVGASGAVVSYPWYVTVHNTVPPIGLADGV